MKLGTIRVEDLRSVTGGNATPAMREHCLTLDRQAMEKASDGSTPHSQRIKLLRDAAACWRKADGS
jgi:hypothetical protein